MGDNVGYQLTGEQPYIKAGQTEGFASPIYWTKGENQVLSADQLKDIDAMEKEWQLYAAHQKFGAIAQSELEFDETPQITPEASGPIDTEKNVKSAESPKGKKAAGKKPTIPVHLKNKAAAAASAIAGVKVQWKELKTEYLTSSRIYAVYHNERLVGNIDFTKEKPTFWQTQAAQEEGEGNEVLLTGPEAEEKAKELGVPTPMLAARIKPGEYIERDGIVMVIAMNAFSVRELKWYVSGYTAPNVPHNMPIDPKLIFHGPTLQAPTASPLPADELISYDDAVGIIKQRRAQHDTIKELFDSSSENLDELEDLEGKASQACQSYRKWINNVLTPATDEPKHFSAGQNEDLINKAFALMNDFDSLSNTISESIDELNARLNATPLQEVNPANIEAGDLGFEQQPSAFETAFGDVTSESATG